MLSRKEIAEIRGHLENAQNPVFLYDNDVDGLCGYIVFRRFIGRGKGVAVKSHPDVDEKYAKKAQELNADYIFVLDRPVLGEKFVNEVKNLQLPIVWIDHHDVEPVKYDYQNIFAFNPMRSDNKSSEPVTYMAYRSTNRREDLWVALAGCIADHYLPDFSEDFAKEFPEYWGKKIEKPFDVYYGTEFGRLIKALSFGLKDSISHVVQLQNFLTSCRSPKELEMELEASKSFGKKYREITKKYNLLLKKAKNVSDGKIIFFNYGGDLSISSDISNELVYLNPGKIIIVAYSSGPITNISMRGNNVKELLGKVLPVLGNATGGGHMDSVGMRIETKYLETFKNEIEKLIL